MTRYALGLLVLLFCAPLAAQENRAWPERTFVTIDVPFELLTNDFSESVRFADSTRKTENVTFVTGYQSTRGAAFDLGVAFRATRKLGAGVTVSQFHHSSSASFSVAVPDPFVANQPLNLAGTVSGLHNGELGIHVQALYALALGKKTRLMMAGGPSIFTRKQDVVKGIEFTILPGFTSLALDHALITRASKTAVGFNVGTNVTWAFASHVALGSVIRYSRANVTLDPGSEASASRRIETRAGGLHLGGGIRLLF
jgi:opacity protein-like surface antigen